MGDPIEKLRDAQAQLQAIPSSQRQTSDTNELIKDAHSWVPAIAVGKDEGFEGIVGHVQHSGEGVNQETENQPHAKATSNAGEPPLRGKDPEEHTLSVTGDAER
jgi:hypothetical protein